MYGIICAILGGILICLQGIFTSRISAKIGLWETNTLVHGVGLALTLVFLALRGDGNLSRFHQVSAVYWPGFCFGAFIVFLVMKGVSGLGPTLATAILLITQLLVATIVDYGGFFETPPVKLDLTKVLGLGIMIAGIVIFKLKD